MQAQVRSGGGEGLAAVCGVRETASRLGLDAARLRQWTRAVGERRVVEAPPQFVELAPLALGTTAECTLETEDGTGRKPGS